MALVENRQVQRPRTEARREKERRYRARARQRNREDQAGRRGTVVSPPPAPPVLERETLKPAEREFVLSAAADLSRRQHCAKARAMRPEEPVASVRGRWTCRFSTRAIAITYRSLACRARGSPPPLGARLCPVACLPLTHNYVGLGRCKAPHNAPIYDIEAPMLCCASPTVGTLSYCAFHTKRFYWSGGS